MINPSQTWKNKFKYYTENLISDCSAVEFTIDLMYTKTSDAWSKFFSESFGVIETMIPVLSPYPWRAIMPSRMLFYPDFRGCRTVSQTVSRIIAQYDAYMASITFEPEPPPMLPFSKIITVYLDTASVQSSSNFLRGELTRILSTLCIYKMHEIRYTEIANAFYAAVLMPQTRIFGLDVENKPLILPSTVF